MICALPLFARCSVSLLIAVVATWHTAGELGFGCKSKRFDTLESKALKVFK